MTDKHRGIIDVYRGIINVDCDGVLYDFTDAMNRYIHSHHSRLYGKSLWSEPTTWDVSESWPIGENEFDEIMYQAIESGAVFREGRVVDLAAGGVLRTLQDEGWHVRIVTSKSFRIPGDYRRQRAVNRIARESTLAWLDANDIPFDTIAFCDSREGKTSYRAQIVVDDKPWTAGWSQNNALNLLYDRPWNKEVALTTPLSNKIVRCIGWSGVLEAIKGSGYA